MEVLGVTDHEGIWKSIYFFDPNGIRLELTYQTRPLNEQDAAAGARGRGPGSPHRNRDGMTAQPGDGSGRGLCPAAGSRRARLPVTAEVTGSRVVIWRD